MGRRERPIEHGPVAGLAAGLRRLRAEAGTPTYRQLAERSHFAPSVLSAAARGARLPTWAVTQAFVQACGGDVAQWREHWRAVSGAVQPPAADKDRATAAPCTLPAETRAFTGRTEELARLLALVDGSDAGADCANGGGDDNGGRDGGPGTVMIAAIDGMAGVGKTALALSAGHLLAERFPDGQLYIDLRGYTRGLAPREPAEALAAVLQALGAAPDRLPSDVDALATLYRGRLSGTRTLVLLDNAAGEAQVRPLLPGAGECFVLVTSRRRLKALDDAHALALDVLPPADAVALLRQAAGPRHGGPGDPLLGEIAELCGRLPLALRIAAALLRHRPAWTARRLAGKLREGGSGLEGFFDGDRDLATVFDLSYRALERDERLLFRRLGLIPGADIDAHAAAALLNTGPVGAERLLQRLVDHNLLAEPVPGRYRLHNLIRLHARALAERDPAEERAAATDRLLNHYAHTAHTAGRAGTHNARRTRAGHANPGPAHATSTADRDRVLGWLLHVEHANLPVSALHTAAETTTHLGNHTDTRTT
jgi:hypothetical protein